MKNKRVNNKYLFLVMIMFSSLFAYGEALEITENDRTFMPKALLKMDSKFSHHVALVEKSTHTLYLYENENGNPKLVKKYRIASGKVSGDKLEQGDYKTPEGIYQLTSFLSKDTLLEKYGDYAKIYGIGAFSMNYPNVIDQRQGKTGNGIWLHSTDDDTRIEKGLDSRGCVVAVDEDLVDISRFVDLDHTSIIIMQELAFIKKDTWYKQRQSIQETVNSWMSSWKNEDFDNYINSYSKEFRDPRKGGNLSGFKRYKKAVFSRPGQPDISISDVSILMHDEYAVVQMVQTYQSNTIQDTGKKVLYLKRDDQYNWKIVAEQWSKLPENRNLAFTPSLRFFKSEKSIVKQ